MTDTIQVSRAEYEELKRDAELYRWILNNAKATDALWKYAIPAEIEARERHISNAIRAAINMPANGEGGE